MDKRKRIIIIGVVVLLVIAMSGVIFWYLTRSDRNTTAELPNEVRNSLENGECDDSAVSSISSSVDSQKDAESRAERYEELANCYVYRKDYDGAISAYEKAAEQFNEAGQADRTDQVNTTIRILNEVKSLPKEVEDKEVEGAAAY